ncbi:recombination regulator RecX [Undibacterium sp. TJN19]|uniref:recombination regulator RecX n=1 Tax=Undibacterium sp. TJN19 TaxID=3413055 RepID=UPI003BF2856A
MKKPIISLKARALRYLSMREHSRMELERKLAPYVQEGEDVEAVLNFLEAAKYLSGERFSESLVNRRQARFGNNRILAELQSHGLQSQDIDAVKEGLQASEQERAIQVLHRKFRTAPADHQEKMKQAAFLQQRGFSSRAIQAAMRAPRDEDEID